MRSIGSLLPTLLQSALELDVLFFGAAPGDRVADVGQQFFVVPGLLDEICRAALNGLHGVFYRAVGGNHDDGEHGVAVADFRKHVEAVLVGQREVKQRQVEGARGMQGKALFGRGGRFHFVIVKFEQGLQRLADRRLIVDDED
jgi:hypothetical protein